MSSGRGWGSPQGRGLVAHPRSRAAGRGVCDAHSLLNQRKCLTGSPRAASLPVSPRKEMPSGTGETGSPRRRPVTEGLPGPEPAASSGAACAAATQSYRFRAEATSSHTCTANSGLFFSFQLTVGSQGKEAPPAPGILGPRLPSLARLPDSAPGAAKTGLGRSGLIPGARLSPLSREGCVGTGQVLRQNRVQTRP